MVAAKLISPQDDDEGRRGDAAGKEDDSSTTFSNPRSPPVVASSIQPSSSNNRWRPFASRNNNKPNSSSSLSSLSPSRVAAAAGGAATAANNSGVLNVPEAKGIGVAGEGVIFPFADDGKGVTAEGMMMDSSSSPLLSSPVSLSSGYSPILTPTLDKQVHIRSPASEGPMTIVLVGGFLLPPNDGFVKRYWGEALNFSNYCVIVVHPGPIASLHDR